jgi:hypothetical protein
VLTLLGPPEGYVDVLSYRVICYEPSAGVVNNLEFKIKKEGSYNYKYKKGLRPQPH